MFNSDFFPTPRHVIELMLLNEKLKGKNVLEPSAGKGDIVDFCIGAGANVSACEVSPDLQQILFNKCRVIHPDFLQLSSDQISHIQLIVMNPPFSADEKHILHAYEIAPPGCKIIALCNWQTLNNRYSSLRLRLSGLVKDYGTSQNLGDCFSDAERKTGVEIGLVTLQKPGGDYEAEFEGFFMDEEPEEAQATGMIPYNFIRDVVNRYVAAVKLYDEQLATGLKMNALLNNFYHSDLSFSCTLDKKQILRNDFKKDLQKSGWNFVIKKMNMEKYATRGLREDINKFVENQIQVPFTMRNIYKMLEIIIGTHVERMGKALIEVFDKVTLRYHENRYNLEGWKTNSHYLINEKFILDGICWQDQRWYKGSSIEMSGSNTETIEDLVKALTFLMGDNYADFISLYAYVKDEYKIYHDGKIIGTERQYLYAESKRADFAKQGKTVTIKSEKPVYGQWFDWAYFEIKAFKKGTMHFKFKDKEVWGRFNQKVAQLKGYPLYEPKKTA